MIFVEGLIVFVIIAFIWMLVTMIMFKKLNKARIKGVLLIFLAFIGVAVVILTVGHFLEWHETNEFCTSFFCHSMEGPYESYTQPKNNTMMEIHYEEDVTCAQCHSGPGIGGFGKSFLPVPNEMLHQYILGYDEDDFGGHVPAENCIKGCHQDAGRDWKFEAPKPKGEGYNYINGTLVWKRIEIFHPLTKNGTDHSELKELETCMECHDARDNSFGFTAEACHICHDVHEEELKAHGESTCSMATCHVDKDGNPVQPKLTGHNTVLDHCMECHSREHPENAFVPYTITNSKGTTLTVNSTFCSNCHRDTYNNFRETGSKHYEENDCTECHLEHKTRLDCKDCHDQSDDLKPIHPIDQPYEICTDCHNSAHDPKSISFQVQSVSIDFCANVSCHGGPGKAVSEFKNYGFRHSENIDDCAECHNEHGQQELDCLLCHGQDGLAPLPNHNITNQYDDCQGCHNHPHAPLNITLTGNDIENGFCSEISCHGGSQGASNIYEVYGEDHKKEFPKCTSCHDIHQSFDTILDVKNNCLDCHSSSPSNHNGPYSKDGCLGCHNSPHDPNNRAPSMGSILSQRDYMTQYFELDISDTTNSFRWVDRGNHEDYGSCSQCHSSAEEAIYPAIYKNILNVSGSDCSGSCHTWIDSMSTGQPFDLLTSSGNPFSGHQISLFENTTSGGCGGTCHQSDPSNPVYDGSGHGTITSCLASSCHGTEFTPLGSLHTSHGDMLTWTDPDLECGAVCHKGFQENSEPIDGGCYDCHKSGHNPRILSTTPCYSGPCHSQNYDP